MSAVNLPNKLFVRKACSASAVYDATVPVASIEDLGENTSLVDDIKVLLRFGHDEHGKYQLEVKADVLVKMQCQRCLEFFERSIPIDSTLRIVASEEESERLDSDVDFLIAEDGEMSSLDMLREEILLALPLVPMHEGEELVDCAAVEYISNISKDGFVDDQPKEGPADDGDADVTRRSEVGMSNPFDALKALKS